MKKWQKRRVTNNSGNGKIMLTTKMFLGKEGNFQFITADELFTFNDNSREEDIEEMSAFFDLAKAGHRIIITRKTRKDQGGNVYKFQNFNRNGNPDGAKVLSVGKILISSKGCMTASLLSTSLMMN